MGSQPAGGNVIDISERLAIRAFEEAQRNLLGAVVVASGWALEWGMPWVYGDPEQTGVTLDLLADATGFHRRVIKRQVRLAEIETFEGVMRDIAVEQHRATGLAIDLVDIPLLLLRLQPCYLRKPDVKQRTQRLRDLARAVRRAICGLPQVEEATIEFFEEIGLLNAQS